MRFRSGCLQKWLAVRPSPFLRGIRQNARSDKGARAKGAARASLVRVFMVVSVLADLRCCRCVLGARSELDSLSASARGSCRSHGS